jgi:hypothetical protein
VPTGIQGELFIGGAGLARGYHGQPALTAARFVADPFATNGSRLYRTGDLARWNPDGQLEFIGRTDHQINHHGHRIEPAEIETALTAYPAIGTAVVVHDRHRLTAYLTTPDGRPPTITQLRGHLAARLPRHMIPTHFVHLPQLPLTRSGKVDRAALPAPDHTRPELAAEYAPPATPLELALADIWKRVLRLDDIGIHDDFFELGGHSLLATQIIARTRTRLGVDVPLVAMFDTPTIAGLAGHVEQALIDKIERMPEDQVRRLLARDGADS